MDEQELADKADSTTATDDNAASSAEDEQEETELPEGEKPEEAKD